MGTYSRKKCHLKFSSDNLLSLYAAGDMTVHAWQKQHVHWKFQGEMHEVNVPYTLVYVNYGTSKRHHHNTVIKHIILSVCDFNSCGHCMVDFLRKCST